MTATSYLNPDGILAETIKNFEPRPEQIKMTEDVERAYNEKGIALIEAGTGTGKSVAYLLPALIHAAKKGERTVISTNTITLQEQLIKKDIPMLLKALNINLKAVLAKGMGNYLCLRKLKEAAYERPFLPENQQLELDDIEAWGANTSTGCRSTLANRPSSTVWEMVNAESDTCTSKKCPFYKECHFFKARKEAEDAKIIVVNHHLLFADLALRFESEDGGLLPDFSRLILDEAHHIEDVATEFFARNVHSLGLYKLLSRLSHEKRGGGKLEALRKVLLRHPSSKTYINRLTLDLPEKKKLILTLVSQAFNAFSLLTTDENRLRIKEHHKKADIWKEQIEG